MEPRSGKLPIPLDPAELRGLVRLIAEAVEGVTGIVEGVHQSVWSTLGFPGGRTAATTRGATGLVYAGIRGITRGVGRGLDGAFAALDPLLRRVAYVPEDSMARTALVAALNGVIGDRLVASNNPLATPMTLRITREHGPAGQRAAPSVLPRKVLLLIHGLCMHDGQWCVVHKAKSVDLGSRLASNLGHVPVYLRYNSGLHVSDNGRELATMLERAFASEELVADEIDVLAHSMGGLVIRAAIDAAQRLGHVWPARLRRIVFLGTPHHGAPLERSGNGVDRLLAMTRYTAPFARLGQLRSAGITDLRHGSVCEADWSGVDRFAAARRKPVVLPLPAGVACHAIAATTAARRGPLADRLTGDGLVPLRSALGQHDDPARDLGFASHASWIAYRTSHLALLHDDAVAQRVQDWLAYPTR